MLQRKEEQIKIIIMPSVNISIIKTFSKNVNNKIEIFIIPYVYNDFCYKC